MLRSVRLAGRGLSFTARSVRSQLRKAGPTSPTHGTIFFFTCALQPPPRWSGEERRNVSELVALCRSLPTSTSDREYTKVYFWYSLHASKLIHGTTRNVLYPPCSGGRRFLLGSVGNYTERWGRSNALATVVLDPSRATITTCISTPDFAGAKANPPGCCGLPADG